MNFKRKIASARIVKIYLLTIAVRTAPSLGRTQPATASHTSCPSSPAAATLHEKTQCFALRLPSQHKPPATSMQPAHCVLQHHVANPHVSTHMATKHDNIHVAILQLEIPQVHRTTCAHEQPLVAEHRGETDSTSKRPQPQLSHTRGTFQHNVSCSGFLPNTKSHAKFMPTL